ncbi:leucine-rich PPR motif-containing protein, mitochondrial [Bacillus rossius redtenbacheri]|uniref:leucine-rich PPR motif-containing protein, mitochondrial n=1 Tax=Bacillus rossius redtenbacheri TaxID=93214 RepID=UPI002FDEECBC
MAFILRSWKFMRHITCFSRNIRQISFKRDIDALLASQGRTSACNLNYFATQAAPSQANNGNLERSLRRLDQDARRAGRISKRELEDILDELRLTRSATSSQSLLIIRCCGNLVPEESPEVRTRLVEEIWKTLENLGVPMDVSHYNALLRVYLENEHKFSPTEFLADMEKKGIEPNRVTYQRLIAHYCQLGDIAGATQILEFMREKQLPVNEGVFNALIMGHSRADDMESAAGILGVMRQAGLEPSADTYTTLMCGHARRGDRGAIEQLLRECDAKDMYFLDKDYMEVVYELAVGGHPQHVDLLIARMRHSAGFNQDAINLILRLVSQGQEDIGLKMLKTMPKPSSSDGQQYPSGGFFIRQLVKASRPVEKIVSLCEELESDGDNPNALLTATETALREGKVQLAPRLLSALKERGHPVRQHYFWPIMVAHGKAKNDEGVLMVLTQMMTEFGLPPSNETLRDYVIPNLSVEAPQAVISKLVSAGVSPAASTCALVVNLINQGQLSKAVEVGNMNRAYYSPTMIRRPLVMAFSATRDVKSFVALVRLVYEGIDRVSDLSAGDEDSPGQAVPDRSDLVGQILLEVAGFVRTDKLQAVEAVLKALVAEGLSISNSSAEILQEKLGEQLTSEISTLLGKLTSGDLVPVAITRQSTTPQMDEAQIQRLIAHYEGKGESPHGLQRQLLSLYCRVKDLEKADKLFEELKQSDFVFTSAIYSMLVDLYVYHEDLERALGILKLMKEKEPDATLSDMKVVKLATLMVKNDKVEDALALLQGQPEDRRQEDRSFPYSTACWRLLNALAEAGRPDELKRIFDVLVQRKFVEVSNVLLGPLVKVHIVRNELGDAMAEFEWCCLNYRLTPFKNDLTRKLIEAEDAASLQKLTDLSTQVHGEVNSLYDLVFAFVECGRIRQARKILETPGLRSRYSRMNAICEHYTQEGRVEHLEGLAEATRDLSHIDRAHIYFHLLKSYYKAKDVDKAVGLWTRMQEEDVQPSDQFLALLGAFLQEQGRHVPFAVPSVAPPPPVPPRRPGVTSVTPESDLSRLRQALAYDDADHALEVMDKMQRAGQSVNRLMQSSLVEKLIKANRLGEASKMVLSMLEKESTPTNRVFNFLMNRLAMAGDVDTLVKIGAHLTPDQKKAVTYDNRLCNAYASSGRSSEYLGLLERELEQARDEDLDQIAEKFPRGGAVGLLEEHPEVVPQFEQLAEKFVARGIVAPVNVLWGHLLVRGQDERARRIWDEHLASSPRVMFHGVLDAAYKNGDVALVRKLLGVLTGSAVSEQAVAAVYSAGVSILTRGDKCEEALKMLEEGVQATCLENINRVVLRRLKDKLEQRGMTFPYNIPDKNAKHSSSSSSSSSDED